jgi:hypothetical protein
MTHKKSSALAFWFGFYSASRIGIVRGAHGRFTSEVRGQGLVATTAVSFALSLLARAVRKLLPRRHGAGQVMHGAAARAIILR